MPFTSHEDFTTLGECVERGWALRANCGVCRRSVKWGRDELSRFPPGVTLDDLAARMRCGVCGAVDGVIHRVQDHVPRAPKVVPLQVNVELAGKSWHGSWVVEGADLIVRSAYGSRREPLGKAKPELKAQRILREMVEAWRGK